VLGAKPSASKRFTQYWGVDALNTVILRPGETHVHYIKVVMNKALANSYLQSVQNRIALVSATLPYIGGVTRGVMWTQEGGLEKDIGGTVKVTTAANETGMILALNYSYQLLNFPSSIITADLGVLSNTGVATFVNEATGAIVTNAVV